MTASRVLFRIALGGTGLSILCAMGLALLNVISFATVYLIELSPSLRDIRSVRDAERLFDSVCMTFPRTFDGALSDSLLVAADCGSECGLISK